MFGTLRVYVLYRLSSIDIFDWCFRAVERFIEYVPAISLSDHNESPTIDHHHEIVISFIKSMLNLLTQTDVESLDRSTTAVQNSTVKKQQLMVRFWVLLCCFIFIIPQLS